MWLQGPDLGAALSNHDTALSDLGSASVRPRCCSVQPRHCSVRPWVGSASIRPWRCSVRPRRCSVQPRVSVHPTSGLLCPASGQFLSNLCAALCLSGLGKALTNLCSTLSNLGAALSDLSSALHFQSFSCCQQLWFPADHMTRSAQC